jgi:hypothetical protein
MNQAEEKKKWMIDNIDRILQIRVEEFKSEKEMTAFYRERYRETAHNFRDKIFGSAAVVATLLTAILAFKGLPPYIFNALITFLVTGRIRCSW